MSRFVTFIMAAGVALLVLSGAGCSGGGSKSCDLAAQTGCDGGQACEAVQGGAPACFDPVVLTGRVLDLATAAPLSDARVVALDANRAPASGTARSAGDGAYRLALPCARRADGTPVTPAVTLRADRAGYATFPGGVRQALPLDLSAPKHADGAWSFPAAAADVALLALPAGAGTAAIHGTVALPADGSGVLVVAETSSGGPAVGASAIADRSGAFTILNLAAGDHTVSAYAKGSRYAPAQVTLAAGQDAPVSLARSGDATGTVSGSLQIVNGGLGTATSVILVVESTFDAALVRGDAPPGLRAADVTGAFSIGGVPDGKYVALAAFEDDHLVRDPDTSIGGTQLVHVAVVNGAASVAPSFKVTGALDVVSPGAAGAEAVSSSAPALAWVDDAGERSYDVSVLDAWGNTVWHAAFPAVTGSATASATYGQTAGALSTAHAAELLQPGMYYQFKVISIDNGGTPIAQTEDLKGVFVYLP